MSLDEQVAEAQLRLDEGIKRAGLRNDPIGHALSALRTVLGVLPVFGREMDKAASRAATANDAILAAVKKAAADGGAVRGRAAGWRAAGIGACMLLVGAEIYRWGQHTAATSVHETEVALQAAFRQGHDAARSWLYLMGRNNVDQITAECDQQLRLAPQGSERVCTVRLHL